MNKPLVSVIIPNYNGSKYLESTIISITKQSYENWELLIVDDCSTDKSLEIINKWVAKIPEKIFCYQLIENSGGPATPRNHALEKAKGAFVAFIDSDDIWHPSKLETQINIMIKYDYNFTFTKICEFTDETTLAPLISRPLTISTESIEVKQISLNQMFKKNRIRSGSTSLIKKDLLDRSSVKFNTDKSYIAVEDYLFWLDTLSKTGEYCFKIEKELTFYRLSEESISRGKIKMAKKIFRLLANYPGVSKLGAVYYFITYISLSFITKLSNQKCSALIRY